VTLITIRQIHVLQRVTFNYEYLRTAFGKTVPGDASLSEFKM